MLSLILNTLAIFGVIAILLEFKKLLHRLEGQKNSNYVVSDFLVQDQKVKAIINEVFVMNAEYNHTTTQDFLDKVLNDLKSYNQNQQEIKEAWKADKTSWHETRSWYKAWQHFFKRKTNT
jgi:hypothetical protein